MSAAASVMVIVFFLLIAWALENITTRQNDAERRLTELEAWTRKNMTPEP